LEGSEGVDRMTVNGEDNVALAQACLVISATWENDSYGSTTITRGYIGGGHSLVVHLHAVALGIRQRSEYSGGSR
jgi:hypothetical protein